MEMTYLTQPPKRYTFEQPKLRVWVENYCKGNGQVLNLFAGKVKLNVPELRVDIDENMPANIHVDAYHFVSEMRDSLSIEGPPMLFGVVILDPPYNIRKSREKYEGRWIGKLTKIKNILPGIIRPGGRVISLGYDSVGMSKSRGFKKIALCVVCHGGDHNDTLCLVEEKEN